MFVHYFKFREIGRYQFSNNVTFICILRFVLLQVRKYRRKYLYHNNKQ